MDFHCFSLFLLRQFFIIFLASLGSFLSIYVIFFKFFPGCFKMFFVCLLYFINSRYIYFFLSFSFSSTIFCSFVVYKIMFKVCFQKFGLCVTLFVYYLVLARVFIDEFRIEFWHIQWLQSSYPIEYKIFSSLKL